MQVIIGNETLLIDEEDLHLLSKYEYQPLKNFNNIYFQRKYIENGKQKRTYLHNDIMGCKWVDHVDRNSLNTRRSNLRKTNHRLNAHNSKKRSGTTSKYYGVHYDRKVDKWQAAMQVSGMSIYIGKYRTELEAAKAYDEAVSEWYGSYARLNFT